MKIKHNEIEVPTDGTDPFINCKLDRRNYSDILTDIISTYEDGFVLALNNEWGAGKTTFVKMWRQSLGNKEFKTLYYNAWENDFEKDVLVALISELEELKDADKLVDSKAVENAYKSLVKKAALLTKKVGPGIIRAAFKRYTDTESEDLLKIIEGTSDVALETLEAEITSYTKRKDGLKEFRKSLEELVKNVTSKKPVVFFIDELDRCRPTYAVEVLETVKHLFNVPGIVFVLSIDKEQLGHAVRGVYGSEFLNADEYLRRFIDLEYKIPQPNIQNYINYLYEYFQFSEFFENKNRHQNNTDIDVSRFKIIGYDLFSKKKLELRQLEKLFGRTRLVLKGFDIKHMVFPELILLVAYLYEYKPNFFNEFKTNSLSLQQFCNKLDEIILPIYSFDNRNRIINLYASLLYRYYVDYSDVRTLEKVELLKADDTLTVETELENGYNGLAGAIMRQERDHYSSNLGLSWIIQRFTLTTNFQS